MTMAEILEMAGQIEPGTPSPTREANALQQDVTRRCQNMVDVVEVLDQIPEEDWLPVMRRILDRAEAEIRNATSLLVRAYEGAPPSLPLANPAPAPTVTSSRYISPRRRLIRKRKPLGRSNRR